MADISRNTTPAWQDPHLKDRGDYTEQDIQNIQEKGGILPDFTLDEAEETHLFARVAQALSKTCVLASWRPLCERCFSAV